MQHLVKRSQGGQWTPTNIVYLCGDGTRGCHGWAEANPTRARAEGGWARRSTDPQDRPIQHRLFGWVRLTEDGMFETLPDLDYAATADHMLTSAVDTPGS
jgi:cytochrome c5